MRIQGPSSELQNVSEVRVLRPAVSDTETVLEMLGRCSRASLFRRFHGWTDGRDYFRALLRDRPLDQTLLACFHSSCVGVATLGVAAEGTFDLGVLVEDAWHRRGIGTWLVGSLLVTARNKGIAAVHADVLGDDLFILEGLRRIGPLSVAIESGSFSIEIDLSKESTHPFGNNPPTGLDSANGGDRSIDQARAGELDWRWGVRL